MSGNGASDDLLVRQLPDLCPLYVVSAMMELGKVADLTAYTVRVRA